MHTTPMLNYRGIVATHEMAAVLRALETKTSEADWRLEILGGADNPSPMAQAGREVYFRLRRPGATPQDALNASWAHGVPLGLTPWARWPVLEGEDGSDHNYIFHCLGSWQIIADNLLAEGRGHLAWPSVEAAALTDVGRWEGSHTVERFVQAHLHRIGKNPGPLDGIIGPRTAAILESLALGGSTLNQTANYLKDTVSLGASVGDPKMGIVSIPGRDVVVQAAGGIQVQKRPGGALLSIHGPGRVIVDIGGAA